MFLNEKEPKPETKAQTVLLDFLNATVASILVAIGYFLFINANGFAPGGISGIATIFANLCKINLGYFTMILNIPLFILVFFFADKKSALFLTYYVILQSVLMILFGNVEWFSQFKYVQDEKLLPALAGGVITGIGFALMLRRFGASGGTYAIASLIKKKKPAANVAWLSASMDACVVAIILFVNPTGKVDFTSALCTLVNLFIANEVVDMVLKGFKKGYKFEIITDNPDEISNEIIQKLGRAVTEVDAVGLYSHTDKKLLICLIRKRELGAFYRILKKYPNTFAYLAPISEVMGKFKQ